MDYTQQPTTYKPLGTNETPSFGTQGNAVLALQQKYNRDNPNSKIAEDGKYGKFTYAALNPVSGSKIISSTGPRTELKTFGSQLDKMTNDTDPYLEALQKQALTLQERITNGTVSEAGKKDIAEVTAGAAKKEQAVQDTYDRYKAGLESLGIQTGLSQYAPGLMLDKRVSADIAENTKLRDIQDAEDLAIAKAKQARLDNDADTLKTTLSEIRQIKQEKATAIRQAMQDKRDAYKTLTNTDMMANIIEGAKGYAGDVHKYYEDVASQLNVSVADLIPALAVAKRQIAVQNAKDAKALREKSAGGTLSERKQAKKDEINNWLVVKEKNSPIDPNGWMTPPAWDYLIKNSGLTRKELLDEYGYLIYTPEYAKYRLTPQELKTLTPIE